MQESTSSDVIYRGQLISLRVETVPEPIGGSRRFEIVEHPDAVAVVALRPGTGAGPEVALVRQMRPAAGGELWEIPAGIVAATERDDPQRTAAREFREETGYEAASWRLLARERPSPGFSTENIFIYLATDLQTAPGDVADRPEDPTEISAVRWMPLSEALRLSQTGAIDDGKTIIGLHLANDALAVGEPHMRSDAPPRPGVATLAPSEQRDRSLNLEHLLMEEFIYARTTASEAIADRGRMFDRYLLLIGGVLVAGVGSIYQLSQVEARSLIQPLALGLFLVSGILGIAFFVSLIRLRSAYRDSLITLNVIKEYYIREFRPAMPKVDEVFRWRMATLPRHERFGSVWYLTTHIIALIGSLCFGIATFIGFGLVESGATGNLIDTQTSGTTYLAAGAVALIVYVVHALSFRRSTDTPGTASPAVQRIG